MPSPPGYREIHSARMPTRMSKAWKGAEGMLVLTVVDVEGPDFGAAVVEEAGGGEEGGHGGYCYDVALLLPQHAGEEFSDEDEVRDEVDFEKPFSLLIARLGVISIEHVCKQVVRTSSTVFPMPMPALLTRTVASPCVLRISLQSA